MKIIRWGAVLGAVTALALATPAAAEDETTPPNVLAEHDGLTVTQAACEDGGQITITATGITYYVSSGMRTAGLAARLGGEIVAQEQVAQEDGEYVADETLVLDAPAEDATLEYRWFAGPQRDDLPAWKVGPADGEAWDAVVAAIEALKEAEQRDWDARDTAEFVTWFEVEVFGCPPEPASEPDGDSTCELVDQLEVADEHGRDGYDRDLFGGYDRDALLAESMAEYGDYYSFWDNQHYDDPSEVDVDHTVALAEAWDSGAHAWSEEQRDKFAADPANLTLLTDNLNASKGDRDIAEWLPPYEPHRDEYVLAYVGVKAAYGLTVDPAEQAVLLQLAEELGLCQAAGNGGAGGGEERLPTTGSPLVPALLILGGGGLAAGFVLHRLSRSRRVTFRA